MLSSIDALKNIYKLHERNLSSITKNLGITPAEWRILNCIDTGYLFQEEVAHELALDYSTVSRQLEKVFHKKLVSKNFTQNDRRKILYQLTEQGQRVNMQISQDVSRYEEQIFQSWTPEEKSIFNVQMNRIYRQLIHNK